MSSPDEHNQAAASAPLDPKTKAALDAYVKPVEDDGFTVSLMAKVKLAEANQAIESVDYEDLPIFDSVSPGASMRRWTLSLSIGGAVGLIVSRLIDMDLVDAANATLPKLNVDPAAAANPNVLIAVGLLAASSLLILFADAGFE